MADHGVVPDLVVGTPVAALNGDLLKQLRQGAGVASVAPARRQLTDMANGLELWIKAASQMMNTAKKPGRSKR